MKPALTHRDDKKMWDKNRKARILFFCLRSFCLSVTALHAAEPITNSIGMKLVRFEPAIHGQDQRRLHLPIMDT
jgi:hypothetical protein